MPRISPNALNPRPRLARALRSNVSLISLNLRLNRLGDDGGRAICDVLRNNSTLQRLKLGSNALSSQTAASLGVLLVGRRSRNRRLAGILAPFLQ